MDSQLLSLFNLILQRTAKNGGSEQMFILNRSPIVGACCQVDSGQVQAGILLSLCMCLPHRDLG